MDILESAIEWFVTTTLQLQDRTAEVAAYFIYDAIKVLLLLTIMVFIVGLVRTYITPKRIKKLLGRKKEGTGNILAALLGIPTPFCSCSAVPMFIGLMEAGVPLGVTFSFLIASPMINEIALALLFALFGWQVALLYIASGLFVAILAGIIIGRLHLEKEVEKIHGKDEWNRANMNNWQKRIAFAKEQVMRIVPKTAPYILIAIAIGAIIHGLAPSDMLTSFAGKDNPLAVPLAVLIGVPLYANAAGILPVIQALIGKGMALGTALAFMMSVTALSLPEMIILRRVLKPKLIIIFAGVLAVSFTLVGLLFNAIL